MFRDIVHAVEVAAPLIEAEVVACLIVGGVHVYDRITGKRTLRRLIRAAAILTAAEGQSWRHPILLARAVWAGSPDSLPLPGRVLIAPGAFAPIIGPVDEALAITAVAGITALPSCRVKVIAAWQTTELL